MTAVSSSSETYSGLPVYPLRDVLSQLHLPPPFDAASISSKWRCVLAPSAEDTTEVPSSPTMEDLLLSEESLMHFLEAGIPVRGHVARAAHAHAACGEDSVAWVTGGSWNAFPKPQIALRRGWGAAGTDSQDSSYHKMIGSFSEVFHHQQEVAVPLTEQELQEAAAAAKQNAAGGEDDEGEGEKGGVAIAAAVLSEEDEVLDLQMFHRTDGCPAMPVLGERLVWPSYVDDGAVCDTATWVSQRGMVRHWHLNDSGEFAMQAALPLKGQDGRELSPSMWLRSAVAAPETKKLRRSLCPALSAAAASATTDAKAPVPAMVAIFAPKGGYDWLVHDDESTVLGKVTALDLFTTPDEALPCDAALLPVLTVAVLESGAAPLLIPPNLTQMSIALTDCVVVEQRRVSNLWLDDVSYFLQRCARWQTNPIIYAYVQQDLQDDAFLAGQVVPYLIRVFDEHAAETAYHAAVRRRVVASLYALATNEKHYGTSESTRRSLTALLLLPGGNDAMQRVLQAAPYRSASSSSSSLPSAGHVPTTFREWLDVYWNMSWSWPKAGCVLRTPAVLHPYGARLAVLHQQAYFVPVVYPRDGCRVVYGSEGTTLESTVQQYFEMKQLEGRSKDLLAYLRTRKEPADELLDELF